MKKIHHISILYLINSTLLGLTELANELNTALDFIYPFIA